MTTLSAHGGGAQPASIDTSGRVTGGAALRVYGFDSEADAIAAGYVCEGGPAMSVAIITDAQIASGAWKTEGDPKATAIYTAPATMPVEGGYAVPVYPVNGWGSITPPAPDPIGDTLRTDAVAYWKMEEAQGNTRADSTGHGHDLGEYQFGALPVQSAVGKVGNAAKNFDDSSNAGYLLNTSFNIDVSVTGFCFWGWVWFPQFVPADDNTFKIIGLSGPHLPPVAAQLKVGLLAAPDPAMVIYERAPLSSAITDPLSVGAWHFFVWWHDATAHIQIDNSTIYSDALTTTFYTLKNLNVVEASFTNSVDYVLLDELGLILRPLTTDEKAYLYNSGAGRTLYP